MLFFEPDGKSTMSAVHSGLMMRAFEPVSGQHTERGSKRERERERERERGRACYESVLRYVLTLS